MEAPNSQPPADSSGSWSISTSTGACSLHGDPVLAWLHLVGVVLVGIDEEACEEAVGPVRVVEEPVLL